MEKAIQMEATVKITGDKEHVEKMLSLLDMIDMCQEGYTREFHIFYDGDGAARLKIGFPDGRHLVERNNESWHRLGKGTIKVDFE